MLHSWICNACSYRFKTFRGNPRKVYCPLCQTDCFPKRDYTEERGMTLGEWIAGFGIALLFVLALSLDSWM